jgi:hypothetical protein
MAPQPKKKISRESAQLSVLLLINSILFPVLYFTVANAGFDYILYVYTALAAILAFVFVIYNRGFSRKNVTPEMLPDTMSAEEKKEFIADGERRLSASRWMIAFLFPLVLAVALDVIILILLPMLGITLG